MLLSVLRSPRAALVNVEIVRTFVRLRKLIATNRDLARRFDALEKRYNAQLKGVFDAIPQLMAPPERARRFPSVRRRESRCPHPRGTRLSLSPRWLPRRRAAVSLQPATTGVSGREERIISWPSPANTVDHYWLSVDAVRQPMRVQEERPRV